MAPVEGLELAVDRLVPGEAGTVDDRFADPGIAAPAAFAAKERRVQGQSVIACQRPARVEGGVIRQGADKLDFTTRTPRR